MGKVLFIKTSPRAKGNGDTLVDAALNAAKSAGAETVRVDTRNLSVKPCKACNACMVTGSCVQKDDFGALLDAMKGSDSIVITVPIYMNLPTAQSVTLLNRLFQLFSPAYERSGKGKRLAVMLTFGGSDPEKMQELVDIYKKENGKINPILIKKYKKYIDWILLVYMYNFESSKDILKINTLKRKDVLKTMKKEETEEIDIFKVLEEKSKDIKEEDILKLKNQLAFEYGYKGLSDIPTKESVTNIVHKNVVVEPFETKPKEDDDFEEKDIELPKPKFLIGTEEEEITPAKRGTLVHLCMKNLDFSRDYSLDDVKDLIDDLEAREIITAKEKDAINPWVIFKFTKSNIWSELKEAKECHKEEAFYINVPAKEVMDTTLDENILVQGIIDLYYITKDDELVLLDYKTDFVAQKEPVQMGQEEKLIERHKPQLMLYKDALESGLNRKVDRVWIYSTGLGKEILVK